MRNRAPLLPALALPALLGVAGCASGPEVVCGMEPGEFTGIYGPEGPEFQMTGRLPLDRWRLPPDAGPHACGTLLRLRGREYGVLVDPSGPGLWVDTRGDGDFARMPPGEGASDEGGVYWEATVTFDLARPGEDPRPRPFGLSYSGRIGSPGRLSVESASWLRGRAGLGGKEFDFLVKDANADGCYDDVDRLLVAFDRDGDGFFDFDERTGEGYRGRQRFDLGTGTFRIAAAAEDGSSITFAPAWPDQDPRPFLGTGEPAPPLPATDLEGKPISWEEFRGRKVWLVFWASW